jgi:hypothetical protein
MTIRAKHRERLHFRVRYARWRGAQILAELRATRGRAMNDRLNPKIGRRDVFRVLAIGAATVAATSACMSADAKDAPKKRGFPDNGKARYQADSPEVQTFYRVNRYPAK